MNPQDKWNLQAKLDAALAGNGEGVADSLTDLRAALDEGRSLLAREMDETTECARCSARMSLADVACEDPAPFVVVPVCQKCEPRPYIVYNDRGERFEIPAVCPQGCSDRDMTCPTSRAKAEAKKRVRPL